MLTDDGQTITGHPMITKAHLECMQGSYRRVCVKFKYFSRTSQDFPTVFMDWKFMKNTDLYVKILFLNC